MQQFHSSKRFTNTKFQWIVVLEKLSATFVSHAKRESKVTPMRGRSFHRFFFSFSACLLFALRFCFISFFFFFWPSSKGVWSNFLSLLCAIWHKFLVALYGWKFSFAVKIDSFCNKLLWRMTRKIDVSHGVAVEWRQWQKNTSGNDMRWNESEKVRCQPPERSCTAVRRIASSKCHTKTDLSTRNAKQCTMEIVGSW